MFLVKVFKFKCSQNARFICLQCSTNFIDSWSKFGDNSMWNGLLGSQGPRESSSNYFFIGLPAGLGNSIQLTCGPNPATMPDSMQVYMSLKNHPSVGAASPRQLWVDSRGFDKDISWEVPDENER